MIKLYFKEKNIKTTPLQLLKHKLYLEIKQIRKTILIPTLLLLAFGIVMSFSLSYSVSQKLDTGHFYFFYKHIIFVFIGVILMIFFTIIDFKHIKTISVFCYGFCMLLLIVVLFVNSHIKGASRWIDIGLISIQPSEVFKPFFIVIHCLFIFEFWKKNDINFAICSLTFLGFIVFLFAMQPDYGMIIIYTATTGIQLLFSRIRLQIFAFISIVFSAALILLSLTFDHVRFRILTFLGLGDGDNYQLNIALRAIREGGIFGKGAGMSKLKNLLPDAHNDFIFAVIGEELGGLGYILLIGFYFTIFGSIILFILQNNKRKINQNIQINDIKDIENYYLKRLISVSVLSMFFVAFTINSFVSLGLFPTKGMTLPFVSYGGSSIFSHCIMIGILLNVTKNIYCCERQINNIF